MSVLLARRNLAASLGDLDSIIAAIDQFMKNVQVVLLFLALLVAFSSGTGELADAAVTAGKLPKVDLAGQKSTPCTFDALHFLSSLCMHVRELESMRAASNWL